MQNIVKSHSFESFPEKQRGPGKIRRAARPVPGARASARRTRRSPRRSWATWPSSATRREPGRAINLLANRRPAVRRRRARVEAGVDLGIPSDRQHLAPRDALQSARVERAPSHWASRGPRASTGPVPALAVDEFLISSHLAPIHTTQAGRRSTIFGGPLSREPSTGLFARKCRAMPSRASSRTCGVLRRGGSPSSGCTRDRGACPRIGAGGPRPALARDQGSQRIARGPISSCRSFPGPR